MNNAENKNKMRRNFRMKSSNLVEV